VRGNIDARLQMLESGELDAIVLAAAGGAAVYNAASMQHLCLCQYCISQEVLQGLLALEAQPGS
jgi:porphobilinogen deaminase